ncbi:L-seryl-tRNA(Sec) selenium transferase [Brachybacterium sp. EF45031]|uniref:L-seryl-tRNA(Sec) selenium transferase n=1 Tax=Brachybacterium sillae TaxID=2810536 RepID=UPI00217E4CF8|nr:L-seryl-tRNA(Sec) selenium transferase [Brachybacterium sillae]MCS6712291.1 L-seryl-tRNA(Sec) selenium transferase [Brachybacterium sillae]
MPESPTSAAQDPRRRIPRTDHLLDLPAVVAASASLGEGVVRGLARAVQDRARRGEILPEQVEPELLAALDTRGASSLLPVVNATGVIVHTNLGRAPLSPLARQALQDVAGYADVEFDLTTGARGRRGAGARAALLVACPAAEDALVVNNGAAALLLAVTALAATPAGERHEIVISRGELVEIGAGFRLPDLMESAGARLREVGTTNRTHLADYRDALGKDTAAILSVHTSNFRVIGFTGVPEISELSRLAHDAGVPLIADLGSGLLAPEPALPGEPDATTALTGGADIVLCSGDKLLGGPQAGILLGRAELIARLGRHPLARAVRADKLALAALEATLTGPLPPVRRALRTDPEDLRMRTEAVAARIRRHTGLEATVVPHDGRVGGGGGAEVPLPGWAVRLPGALAAPLRTGRPAVVGTVRDGGLLLDLRCVPEDQEEQLLEALAGVSLGEEPA